MARELKTLQKTGPQRPRYMSVQEMQPIRDAQIHVRGTVHNLGDTVPRGFLQVATTGEPSALPGTQSGRKELGEWIASRQNPLTPRVVVNRVWHCLFGFGISRTPDNFGTTGAEPSHPELLDRLALSLLERDWSIKPIIREIVTSRTYRQASVSSDTKHGTDLENRWLSHQNRRRLDAECLLDAILTVSGQLRDELGGNTVKEGMTEDYGYVHDSRRRAAYWPVFRNALPELFEAFDFADPSLPSGSRNVSMVATQSLFFLNNLWVTSQAKCTARRLLAEPLSNTAARIDLLFRLALGRLPNDRETQIGGNMLWGNESSEDAWTIVIQALFASIDFRYVE